MSNAVLQSKSSKRSFLDREPLLTTAAVAKWLGISTRLVCLWAECKLIPAMKIGRQWRFRQEELSNWLQSPQASKVNNSTHPKGAAAKFGAHFE
jgi:excisionase family DNA binding protein